MVPTFTNGTSQQQQLVLDAVAECTFPLAQLGTTVNFTFGTDIAGHGGKFEAVTDLTQLPTHAEVTVQQDLDNPASPLYFGLAFFKECIIHELGHVVTLQLGEADQRAVATALGLDYDTQWTLAEVGGIWTNAGQEAAAETFKDLFLAKPNRRYDNRTIYRLEASREAAFVTPLADAVPRVINVYLPFPLGSVLSYSYTQVWGRVFLGQPNTLQTDSNYPYTTPQDFLFDDLLDASLLVTAYATQDADTAVPTDTFTFTIGLHNAHYSGGDLTSGLIADITYPTFRGPPSPPLGDGGDAVLWLPSFPGGVYRPNPGVDQGGAMTMTTTLRSLFIAPTHGPSTQLSDLAASDLSIVCSIDGSAQLIVPLCSVGFTFTTTGPGDVPLPPWPYVAPPTPVLVMGAIQAGGPQSGVVRGRPRVVGV